MFDKIAADRLDLDRPTEADVDASLLRGARIKARELIGIFHELDKSPRGSTSFNASAFGRAQDAIETALDEIEMHLKERTK